MIDKMIVDADLCVKLGGSEKYRYLYNILPLVAEKIYMHTYAHLCTPMHMVKLCCRQVQLAS